MNKDLPNKFHDLFPNLPDDIMPVTQSSDVKKSQDKNDAPKKKTTKKTAPKKKTTTKKSKAK